MHNYTLLDLSGALSALVLFPIFLLVPGYVFGWILNIFEFRAKSLTERVLLSTALSFAIAPIVAAILARVASLSAVNLVFLFITAVFAALLISELRIDPGQFKAPVSRETRILLLVMGTWALVSLGLLIDIQVGDRLYLSTSVFDHSIRASFARSILQNGMPPINPLFFPGHSVPLHYYYYWFLLCALPAKILGIDPRLSMYASCAWSALGFSAILLLYLKYFIGDRENLKRKALWAVVLVPVTGLDLIPTAFYCFGPNHTVFAAMDWWDSEMMGSWIASFLWVPHHVAALVACLLGYLVVWHASENPSVANRVKASLIGGLAFASAAGLSVYVTLTFAAFLCTWGLFTLIQRRWAEVLILTAAGLTALLLSLSYLRELRSGGAGGQFVTWGLRWHTGDSLRMLGIDSAVVLHIASFLEMPLMYLIELGFFFVVGLLRLRSAIANRRNLSRWEMASWVMFGTSLFISSFLRSDVITANDLGIRSTMVMQFVLLLWAVPLVYDWRTRSDSFKHSIRPFVKPWTMGAFLCLGLAATLYDATLGRAWAFVHDNTSGSPDYRVPSRDLAGMFYTIRSDFDALNQLLPKNAIVQADPWSHISLPYPLYASRRSISSIPGCGVPFSGPVYESECYRLQLVIGRAFDQPGWLDTQDVDSFCDRFAIDALLVTYKTAIWTVPDAWVWHRQPILSNQWVRVIGCGSRIQH